MSRFFTMKGGGASPNGDGAPQQPKRLQLDPRTALEAAIDEETQLVQFSARGPLDIHPQTVTLPVAYVETIFHTLLGLRLNKHVRPVGGVPGDANTSNTSNTDSST